MILGFIGDVHGRVFHALAAAVTWQRHTGRRFDALVQVGDMGSYPDVARMDAATQAYLAVDPSEADFGRLLHAEGARAGALRALRVQLAGPVYYLRGNHEDFDWLRARPLDADGTAPVDAFGLLRYVRDGAVLDLCGLRIAFLGGAEEFGDGPAGIDRTAYASVRALTPGTIDVLVSHQGPYGIGVGYRGDVQGSRMMTALVERLRPRFHVAGHRHELDRLDAGATSYLGVASLVHSARWQPDTRGLKPGCLAVLDTEEGTLTPVTEAWLSSFQTPFDFEAWCAETQR